MELNPGMWRDAANALVRQTHGELFPEAEQRDQVQKNQQLIRGEIKRLQSLEHPQWFEGFESP